MAGWNREMIKFIAAFATLVIVGGMTFAGPETAVKQRAKDLRDRIETQQGVAPSQPAAPSSPAAPAKPAAPVAPLPPLSLTHLVSDLAALKSKADITPESKQRLVKDFNAAARGRKPSAATLEKLAEDLAQAVAGRDMSASQRTRLARNLHVVLNSADTPQADVDNTISSAQATLQMSGVERPQVLAVANDLRAISAELKKTPTR